MIIFVKILDDLICRIGKKGRFGMFHIASKALVNHIIVFLHEGHPDLRPIYFLRHRWSSYY